MAEGTYYSRNKEEIVLKKKAYYALHKAEINARYEEYRVAYRKRNRALLAKKSKERYHNNKEEILMKARKKNASDKISRETKSEI